MKTQVLPSKNEIRMQVIPARKDLVLPAFSCFYLRTDFGGRRPSPFRGKVSINLKKKKEEKRRKEKKREEKR